MVIREIRLRDYPYKSRKGLSERLVKHLFEKQGFTVFRGTFILGSKYSLYYGLYENVTKKYDLLESILLKKLGLRLYQLREMLASGIPDFFVSKKDSCFFVEVKLEHEQIKKNQFDCMHLLESFGFKVLVFRLKSKVYREKTEVELSSGAKTVWVRQKRFGNV